MKKQKLIPRQRIGFSSGTTSKKETISRHDAIVLFNEARQRLLDINNWYFLCGKKGAEFQLTNEHGVPISSRSPVTGNLIRIKLYAPANESGDGYDWVRIEEFDSIKDLIKDLDIFGFRVRPEQNPNNADPEKAHFYSVAATSSFLIYRHTSTVYAVERGRNEKPNFGADSLWNKLRNAVVAVAAMTGLAKPQWKMLTTGILNGPPKV